MREYTALKKKNNNFATEDDKIVMENDLTALGIFGIQDPLRDDIVKAIDICKGAGIRVIMCTGDNIDTATAISKDAGIVTEDECKGKFACMTGKAFREEIGGKIEITDPDDPEKKIDSVGEIHKFYKVKD